MNFGKGYANVWSLHNTVRRGCKFGLANQIVPIFTWYITIKACAQFYLNKRKSEIDTGKRQIEALLELSRATLQTVPGDSSLEQDPNKY